MRLLYRGHDHDCRQLSEEAKKELPRVLKGSLCRCTGYRAIEDSILGVTKVEADCPGKSVGRSLANPLGQIDRYGASTLHSRRLDGGYAAYQGLAIAACARLASKRFAKKERCKSKGCIASIPGKMFRAGFTPARLMKISMSIPNDSYMLDNVVRFIGQRVAAVVAESEAAAEEAASLIEVDYEVLPAVFDPEDAMKPGAPVVHGDKGVGIANRASGPQHSPRDPWRKWERGSGICRC